MPRPDAALLEPARYPFRCDIQPRFSDLDTNLHLNNVSLVGILEDGRVRFHAASGYHEAIAGMSSMVASNAIEYLGQGFYPDPLEMHVAATRFGNSSYALAQLITQQGRPVLFARTILVLTREGRPAPLPSRFVESAREWMLRP